MMILTAIAAALGIGSAAQADCAPLEAAIYYEWQKSELTRVASETIDTLGRRNRGCALKEVVITGHADGSETGKDIGLDRSKVIRDYLVARGVSASKIRVESRGASEPAYNRRPGAMEPLNRRAIIIVSFN